MLEHQSLSRLKALVKPPDLFNSEMDLTNYYKVSAYCTTAERCKSEAVEKMRRLGIDASEQEDMLDKLIADKFIDEERYAEAFVRDKFRFSKWGKRKIEYALHMKGVPDSAINKAIDTIDPEEYEQTKRQLEQSKIKSLKGDPNDMTNKAKIYRFLASKGFILLALLHFASLNINATGFITGVAPDYAGRTLELLYEDNGISHTAIRVDTCVVDKEGHFRLNTDITETHQCYIPLGIYRGVLYVEPYKLYNINLPPLTLPKEGDLLNPYFSPKEILLSLNHAAADDLNLKITAFDDSFDIAFNNLIKKGITPDAIEQEYSELEYNFGDSDPYFTTYRFCNYAILVNLYEPTQPNTAIDAFFIDAPVSYNNPAYWDAFDILFSQYKDIDALKCNRPLQELVIIHHVAAGMLHENYLKQITTEKNKEIARMVASPEKTITTITNIDGEKLSFKDFESQQIYIIFANSKLSKSISDLDFAAIGNKKWSNRCIVLVVFTDKNKTDIDAATRHLKDRTFLIWESDNQEFVKPFNVKNAPAYFRIDINGNILELPAPEPKDFYL